MGIINYLKKEWRFIIIQLFVVFLVIFIAKIFASIERLTFENWFMLCLWYAILIGISILACWVKSLPEDENPPKDNEVGKPKTFREMIREMKGFILYVLLTFLFLVWTFNYKYSNLKIILPLFIATYVYSSYRMAKDNYNFIDGAFSVMMFIVGIILWFAMVGEVWITERHWNNYSNFLVFSIPSKALILQFPIYLIFKKYKKTKKESVGDY